MPEIGAYQLQELLGEGAFGQVYAATGDGTPVAVKVITDTASTLSLQREILAIAALDHPHIVRIFDFGLLPDDTIGPAGTPFLVMERCSGGTLSSRASTLVSFDEVRSILLKLLSALATAHSRGLIHRDLKLSNVMVCTDDDLRPGIRLVDFGLAGDAGALDLGGTPLYMPPEQHEPNTTHIGPWTDLFALGVLGWRLVSGSPWDSRSRGELLHLKVHERFAEFRPRLKVPDGFEDWLKTLLRARWEGRFLTAAAAVQSLHELGDSVRDSPTIVARSAAELPTELATGEDDPRWTDGAPSTEAAPLAEAPLEYSDAPYSASAALSHAGRALLSVREPSFCGRSTLQREMWQRFRDGQRDGSPVWIDLGGAEGSGRARCAKWLAEQAHIDAGAWTVVLSSLPRPLELVGRVLRVRNVTLSEIKTRLERLEVASAPALQALEALHLQPSQGWVGISLALRILGAVARRHPVVVVCLDVSEDPELERLGQVARELGEPLTVVTTRTGSADLQVEALGRAVLSRLLEGWAPLHWTSAQAVLDGSQGFPGRLVERVKNARLLPSDAGLVLEERVDDLDRLQTLWSDDTRDTARLLANLGPVLLPEALDQVIEGDWNRVLTLLVRERVVEPLPHGWRFRSDSTRRALATLGGTASRSSLNRCSEALERVGLHRQAVDRALEAGMFERAVDLFAAHCQAGQSVDGLRAFVASLEETTLRERVHGRAHRMLVQAALRTRHPDTDTLLETADRLARGLGWHLTAGHLAERSWNYRRTPITIAIEAFERAPANPDRDWYLSSCWMHRAIEEPSQEAWDRALAYADSSGRVGRRAATAAMHALKWLDEPHEAVRHEEVALAHSTGVLQQVSSIMYLQHYLLKAGDWDRVIEIGRDGIRWCELVSNRQFLLFLLLNTALAHARQGDWSAAEDHGSHALALPRHAPTTSIARVICAIHHAKEGRSDAGIDLVPELPALFATLFDTNDPDLFWLLEQLARALGDTPASATVRALVQEHRG